VPELAELDVRVTQLEERMDGVEDLARGTGQEVADWRGTVNGHTKTLNAMSEKIDLFQKRIDERLDKAETEVRKEFADVRSEMRKGFGKLAKGQELITDLLTKHLDAPDEETRAGGADE
jgi:hypothetical protein